MTSTAIQAANDQILFHDHGISLCLIINRRARSLRVVDFRSGFHPTKMAFVMRLARDEGVERVFTLVERDEVSTWSRLGLRREGSIPGFYKRSDAWILGTTVDEYQMVHGDQSGLRRAVHDDPDAEKQYQAARRVAKSWGERPLPAVRLQPAKAPDLKKAVSNAVRSGRALTAFEPFGRDVDRNTYVCTARGGFSLMMSAEIQPCFNNAYLELLQAPRADKEAALTSAALRLLCDELFARDVVCCFAVSPVDEASLAAAYIENGFRRTGVLRAHLPGKELRQDAFLWVRKLALPTDA